MRYNARKASKISKNLYTKLQAMNPNSVKGELTCSFKSETNNFVYVRLK